MPDYSDASPIPLLDIEDHERYRLYAQPDIVRVLRGLLRQRDFVTAYLPDRERYLLTAVIEVLPQEGLLILDYGPDERRNQEALDAGELLCLARPERVDVRFECGPLRPIEHAGHPALASALPASLLRLQRREHFRVATLITSPVLCRITPEPARPLEVAVRDLSAGGIALVDDGGRLGLEPGQLLPECTLELPGFGRITVGLEVRNVLPLPAGEPGQRVGLAFVDLAGNDAALLQRYLNHLQLRRRAEAD